MKKMIHRRWLQGYVFALVQVLRYEGINTTLTDELFKNGVACIANCELAGVNPEDIEILKLYYK